MNSTGSQEATWFRERLQREGRDHYHAHHPFHVLMHEGRLTRQQLQQWVLNRYYYQTRIPIKDAIILSKSEDPAFRRMWIGRIHDHDGDGVTAGGLALWRRLAAGVGLEEDSLTNDQTILPGVRFACDAYVTFVREATLVEAVASSLTELFAPDLIAARIAAWEQHYRWIEPGRFGLFPLPSFARSKDAAQAMDSSWLKRQQPKRKLAASSFKRKTDILWHILDCLYAAYVEQDNGDSRTESSKVSR